MPLSPRASHPSLSPAVRDARSAAPTDPSAREAASTPRDHPALGATLPAESLLAKKPAVVRDNATPRSAVSTPPAEAAPAAKSRSRPSDPMDETPIHARLPPAPPSTHKTELTLIPKQAAPKRRSHPMWPYVLGLLAIGSGAVWFVMQAGLDDPDSTHHP